MNTILNESETVKALIMFQLLSAVNYCHSMKIMHRDLKPENILFENKSQFSDIKIIDFGISSVVMEDVNNERRILTDEKNQSGE